MGVLHALPPEQELGRAPTPTQFEVGTVKASDGTSFVVLELRTPAGEGTYFLDPNFAKGFLAAFERALAEAEHGGIIVPRPVIPKDLNGGPT